MRPVFDLADKYYGVPNNFFEAELMLYEMGDPEEEKYLAISEHVPVSSIWKCFDEYFPNIEERKKRMCLNVIYFIINVSYGDAIVTSGEEWKKNEQELFPTATIWYDVKEDIIRLYRFMMEHKDAKEISISVTDWCKKGGVKVEGNKLKKHSIKLYQYMPNHLGKAWDEFGFKPFTPLALNPDRLSWLHALFFNKLFPNCIPDIKSITDADNQLRKKTGPKRKHKDFIPIIVGTAKFFYDEGLLGEYRTPKNLCEFIRHILVLANWIDEDDTLFDIPRIAAEINNAVAEDKRFPRCPLTRISLEELKNSDKEQNCQDWLFK